MQSGHSYIPSLESPCPALPSLPLLSAGGRHHFSNHTAQLFQPLLPAKTTKIEVMELDWQTLHCSSTKNCIPWEKQRWVSWRGDAIPCIQHGPFPLPLSTWCLRQLSKASQAWGWLLPTSIHTGPCLAGLASTISVVLVCGPPSSTICLEFSTIRLQPHQLK